MNVKEMIAVQGLTKRYGQSAALDGLDMHVPCGAVYGLLGSNGAGKTTLLRVLCGLQKPTSGSYTLFGGNPAGGRMGAMIEGPALWGDMSAADNLRQQLLLLGIPGEEKVQELLKLLGLEGSGKKKTKHFSLGMRQRLGIAMALAGDPELLLLDEPTNGLDPRGVIFLRRLIRRLNCERGMTIVVASHHLDELSRIATHYGVLEKGRMLREMAADEIGESLEACYLALTGGDVDA